MTETVEIDRETLEILIEEAQFSYESLSHDEEWTELRGDDVDEAITKARDQL